MSWGVFPDERSGLSSLLDHLLERSSLDPLWSLLCPTLYWGRLYLTISGFFFARPSNGVIFIWPSLEFLCATLHWSILHLTLCGVLFSWPSTGVITWPSLDSSLLDPLLESPLDPLWSLLCSTLYWSHHLTLPGVSLLDPLLESSFDPLWSLLCLTFYQRDGCLLVLLFLWPDL
jgi:hypothetical protein